MRSGRYLAATAVFVRVLSCLLIEASSGRHAVLEPNGNGRMCRISSEVRISRRNMSTDAVTNGT